MPSLIDPTKASHRAARASVRVAILTFLVLVGTARSGWAVQAGADMAPWEPWAEARAAVLDALSQRWGVVAEALVLEWGEPRGGEVDPNLRHVELIGHGRDGRWVVRFRRAPGSGQARSVLLRAGVRVTQPVARRPLERGAVIRMEDMEPREMVHWGPTSSLPRPCEAGWVVQRPMSTGEPLREPGVRPPLLVRSGKPVRARWSNGQVVLEFQAVASASGALGERVLVRTTDGSRLSGVVKGPGLVLLSNDGMESGR